MIVSSAIFWYSCSPMLMQKKLSIGSAGMNAPSRLFENSDSWTGVVVVEIVGAQN